MSDDIPDFGTGPALRTIAMPADTNPAGDIFGGWLMAQMDLAGSVRAIDAAQGRIVTIGVEAMKFHKPVRVGDEVMCFATTLRRGKTSITIQIETWVRRRLTGECLKVTEAAFTYVAVDQEGNKRALPPA